VYPEVEVREMSVGEVGVVSLIEAEEVLVRQVEEI